MSNNNNINERLESDLSSALMEDQLYIVYQPQYAITDNSLIGLEVLSRWKHPELGDISPANFIPIAEHNGLIIEIGNWVMRTAFKHYQQWRSMQIVSDDFKLAVNVSPIQLIQDQFIKKFGELLKQTEMDAKNVELELTETYFLSNSQEILDVLNQLKAMGVSLALDDFGVGYSSLSRLKDLPFTALKLDKTFIDNIANEKIAEKIVKAIIGLGNDLNMNIIAEGIESEKQLEILSKHHCHVGQGFYFEGSNFDYYEMTDFLKRHHH